MSDKLSDLSPQRQQEVVEQRIQDDLAFARHAATSRDPIVLQTRLLDLEARAAGLDMRYTETLGDDEVE